MKELLESVASFSVALGLYPLSQVKNIFVEEGDEKGSLVLARAVETAATAVVEQLGPLQIVFAPLDTLQRSVIAVGSRMLWPFGGFEWHEFKGDRGNHKPGFQILPTSVVTDKSDVRPSVTSDGKDTAERWLVATVNNDKGDLAQPVSLKSPYKRKKYAQN